MVWSFPQGKGRREEGSGKSWGTTDHVLVVVWEVLSVISYFYCLLQHWTLRPLWTLALSCCAAWRVAPKSPPASPAGPVLLEGPSAIACCEPEPERGSLCTPGRQNVGTRSTKITENRRKKIILPTLTSWFDLGRVQIVCTECRLTRPTPQLYIIHQKQGKRRYAETLTLIIALEVMRNSVALSVTWRILSPASPVKRKLSSSDKDLK